MCGPVYNYTHAVLHCSSNGSLTDLSKFLTKGCPAASAKSERKGCVHTFVRSYCAKMCQLEEAKAALLLYMWPQMSIWSDSNL